MICKDYYDEEKCVSTYSELTDYLDFFMSFHYNTNTRMKI